MRQHAFAIWWSVAVLVFAVPVSAQDDGKDVRLTRAHFDVHAAALEFTLAQHRAAETQFAEYEREFIDTHEAYVAMVEWLWTATSSSDWYGGESIEEFTAIISRKSRKADEAWRIAARRLERRWFDGLRRIAIGREESVESLRRARLRQRMFTPDRSWEVEGAQTDLMAILNAIDESLAEEPAMRDALDAYERQLNTLLRAHDELFVVHRSRLRTQIDSMRVAESAGEDATGLRHGVAELFVNWTQSQAAIWRLNQQTSLALLAIIPDAHRVAFEDAVYASLHRYVRIENATTPDGAFVQAFSGDSLSRDQRERLESLRTRWRAQRAAALPGLTSAYLRTVDSKSLHAYWVAALGNRGRRTPHPAWDEWIVQRDLWLTECAEVIASINGVLAESAEPLAASTVVAPTPSTLLEEHLRDEFRPSISSARFEAAMNEMSLSAEEASTAHHIFARLLETYTRESAALLQKLIEVGKNQDPTKPNLRFHCEWWDSNLAFDSNVEEQVAAAISDERRRLQWREIMCDCRRERFIEELNRKQRQRYAIDLMPIIKELTLSDVEKTRLAAITTAYADAMDECAMGFMVAATL